MWAGGFCWCICNIFKVYLHNHPYWTCKVTCFACLVHWKGDVFWGLPCPVRWSCASLDTRVLGKPPRYWHWQTSPLTPCSRFLERKDGVMGCKSIWKVIIWRRWKMWKWSSIFRSEIHSNYLWLDRLDDLFCLHIQRYMKRNIMAVISCVCSVPFASAV